MKRKALMVVLCVVMLGALVASAQAAWYTCTVNQAGQSGVVYFCQLTEVSGATWTGPRYFFIDSTAGVQNAMLATLLTAFANSSNVQVWLEYPGEWWTITGVTASK
jgi:hypothetical protein